MPPDTCFHRLFPPVLLVAQSENHLQPKLNRSTLCGCSGDAPDASNIFSGDAKTELAGGPKLGLVRILKDSARNCTLTDSRGFKLLSQNISRLISFRPITVSRPMF